jgi:hypothetical protein
MSNIDMPDQDDDVWKNKVVGPISSGIWCAEQDLKNNSIRRFDPVLKPISHISKELFDSLVWENARVVDLTILRNGEDGQIYWSIGIKLKGCEVVTHYVSLVCKKDDLKRKIENVIKNLDQPIHKHHNED